MRATVGVVVTGFDQGDLVREAVESVLRQTRAPDEVVVVDDGSTDARSLAVLDALAGHEAVRVLRQENAGVSAARNAGLSRLTTELAVVLDGDDRLAETFVARTAALLEEDPDVVGSSSWLRMHGVAHAVARPAGGAAVDFLHRNASPATVMLRRDRWLAAGGYDERMRAGFEDWDFFLSLLSAGGRIEIVPEPLIEYRTSPTSANVRSMDKRLELYGHLVDRHRPLFEEHLRAVLLAQEAASTARLDTWERLVLDHPEVPVEDATYGDGGMAAVVRIATARAERARAVGPVLQP
ncbi:glycosyltransferase family 2 protein [Oerskovia rustica]|uniref:Glycosyltransferase family 2 protein n=1 Tax=Oerskovia rustica TaxID=2762237 RepID=A0ABR8RSC1_9CELL|nr:glycosyltransferase family A protein [Oerskovia rustica]MBD7950668.1 glycosyltransferase family 2 protein [Oerskovia rustica]